jgi:plastocyanin
MVALFRSASTEKGQPRPEFAAELQARLEHELQRPANPRHFLKGKGETNTLKHPIAILVALSLLTVAIASCGGSGGNSSSTEIHMGDATFLQSSVTISKGSSLNLIDDVAVTHIIGNGSWVNGVIKPAIEPGAPSVNNLTFNSASQSMAVGPFNTTGTYHLYCSVHVNMNLTVIVQ